MRFFVVLLLVLTLSATANAKPLQEILTFEQFKTLVKQKVKRIPDLEALWDFQKSKDTNIYFAGGALRGLLHWIYLQLQNRTPEEVATLRTPKISELLMQESSDRDLVAPEIERAALIAIEPKYSDWDILSSEFYKAAVNAGGANLEKVIVNPTSIHDPYDGLRQFYEGHLVFKWVEEGGQIANALLKKNSRTTLALRYLRFLQEFPELTADPESLAHIKSIPENEVGSIESENYWVSKALKKLYLACKKDPLRFFDVLRSAGLLDHLREIGVQVAPKETTIDVANKSAWQKLFDLGLSIAEVRDLQSILGKRTIGQLISYHAANMQGAKTAEDFVAAVDFFVSEPNDDYKSDLGKLVEQNAGRFVRLPGITVGLVKKLMARGLFTNVLEKLMVEAISKGLVKSAEDYIELLSIDWAKGRASEHYKEIVSKIIVNTADKFAQFSDATVDAALKLSAHGPQKISGNIAIKQALVKLGKVKDFADFVRLCNDTKSQSEDYKKANDKFITDVATPQLFKDATIEDVKNLIKTPGVFYWKTVVMIKRLHLKAHPPSSIGEYFALMGSEWTNYQQDYSNERIILLKESLAYYLKKFKLEVVDISKLISALNYFSIAEAILVRQSALDVGLIKDVDGFLSLAQIEVTNPNSDYLNSLKEFFETNVGPFCERANISLPDSAKLIRVLNLGENAKLALAKNKSSESLSFEESLNLYSEWGKVFGAMSPQLVTLFAKKIVAKIKTQSDMDTLVAVLGSDIDLNDKRKWGRVFKDMKAYLLSKNVKVLSIPGVLSLGSRLATVAGMIARMSVVSPKRFLVPPVSFEECRNAIKGL